MSPLSLEFWRFERMRSSRFSFSSFIIKVYFSFLAKLAGWDVAEPVLGRHSVCDFQPSL